jgi:hypothetical protein
VKINKLFREKKRGLDKVGVHREKKDWATKAQARKSRKISDIT